MASNGTTGPWSEEKTALLCALWTAGHTGAEIAAKLEGEDSRCAVIAKAHRLGLGGRPPRPQKPRKPRPSRARVERPKAPILAKAPRPAKVDLTIRSEPVDIEALRDWMCRYPLGDPLSEDFRYCGGVAQTAKPYCPGHMKIAYYPLKVAP
jgi:GcrA cell cycle regulator